MTDLREQISPLLKEFQMATGRGNLLTANTILLKVFEVLLTAYEQQTVQFAMYSYGAKLHQSVKQDDFVVGGEVELDVDLGDTDTKTENLDELHNPRLQPVAVAKARGKPGRKPKPKA